MKKTNILIIAFAIVILTIMALAITNVIEETLGMCIALFLVILFNLLMAIVAHKHNIKIIEWLMILFMLIGAVLFGVNLYSLLDKPEESSKIQVIATPNTSEKTQIFSYSNRNFYTYNLSNIEIMFIESNKRYPLKEALEDKLTTLDEILSEAIPNSDTKGYKIYYDGGESDFDHDEYAIVMCENSGDVIFTNYDYTYEPTMCEELSLKIDSDHTSDSGTSNEN